MASGSDLALASRKSALRCVAARRRSDLHRKLAVTAPSAILSRFRERWPARPGLVISGFMPIRSEPDLRPLLHDLDDAGWTVALPVVEARGQPLKFRRWTPDSSLETGHFGVPVPVAGAEVEPDWLLVPLLAYDRAGYRLGYGGGFYDMTLSALRRHRTIKAIGVGYDGLEVDAVPHGPEDSRLCAILTEQRIIKVKG